MVEAIRQNQAFLRSKRNSHPQSDLYRTDCVLSARTDSNGNRLQKNDAADQSMAKGQTVEAGPALAAPYQR